MAATSRRRPASRAPRALVKPPGKDRVRPRRCNRPRTPFAAVQIRQMEPATLRRIASETNRQNEVERPRHGGAFSSFLRRGNRHRVADFRCWPVSTVCAPCELNLHTDAASKLSRGLRSEMPSRELACNQYTLNRRPGSDVCSRKRCRPAKSVWRALVLTHLKARPCGVPPRRSGRVC